MDTMVTKPLLKSLVPFLASLIGPLILTTFRNNYASSLFDETSQHLFRSTINDGQPGTTNGELEALSQLPWGTFKLFRYIEAIGYSYVWFLTAMMIIEIVICGLNRLVKSWRQIQVGHEQQPSNKIFQPLVPTIKKCVVYIVKVVFLYSSCYVFYILLFVAVYYACIPISEQGRVFQQAKPSEVIEGLNFQQISPGAAETENHMREPRILETLTSNTYQTLFQTSMTVGSILLSRNGHKAFTAILDTASKCSLQIMDISNTSSPIFLGNTSFTMTYTSEYPWGNTLALSSDERVILMATGSDLHIIDISDVRHPLKVGLYPLSKLESIQSILISSDSKTAFLLTYTASLKTPYLVKAVNITVRHSPKFIETIFRSTKPLKLFTSGEFLIYADDKEINKYNISDFTNFGDPESISIAGFGPLSSSLVQMTSDLEYAYWIRYYSNATVYRLYSLNLSASDDSASETDLTDDAQPYLESTRPQRLFLSPDGKLVLYISDQLVQPYSTSEHNFLSAITISSVNCLAMSLDEQTLLLGAGGEFYILQLYFNIEPRQVVNTINLADNILSPNLGFDDAIYQIALSPNGKTLYGLSHAGISTLNVSDSSSPHKISPHFVGTINQTINQIAVSPDGQMLFGISFLSNSTSTNLTLYNASDAQVISYWNFDNFGYTPYQHRETIQSFVITPDGNTALLIQSFTNFLILDISSPSNISVLSNTTYSPFSAVSIALSTDGQTVFISGINMNASSTSSSLKVYDISTPSSPKPISEFDQIPGVMTSMTLSHNETVAYALIEPVDQVNIGVQYICVLFIINISSLDAPVFITSMNLADNCTDTQSGPAIPVTPDLEVLYVLLEDTSVYVDVSNSSAPQVMDVDFQPSPCVAISHDFRILYIIYQPTLDGDNEEYGFFITDVLPKFVPSLSSNTLALGSSYTNELNILRSGLHGTYVPTDFYYKFINAQLYYPSISVNGVPMVSLPEWINLDETNGFITFSPTSASQIGSYYIYVTFSTQISFDSFANSLRKDGIPINQTNVSSLLGILTELGYVDNDLFVSISDTSDWSEGSDSSDVAQLEQVKIIEKAVSPYVDKSNVFPLMEVLTKFLSTAVTKFTITPSLTLTLNSSVLPSSSSSPIAVNTLSLAPLSIVITLEGHDTRPQFVTIGYSFTASFSVTNSQITMVNSLQDVNTALSQLVIFLNGLEYCNGTITVVDDLNPTLNQHVFNLSGYFLKSSPPVVNTTYFQSQLATGFPETGTQFAVRFDTSTFTDLTGQPLTFALQMQDSSLQTPDWLQLTEDTLTGTPPDQLSGRQLDLKIVVSNQYQSTEIEFSLNVAISLEYALKLIGTYGGALITCLGLLMYAPHIYNIICKRLYRYPKHFVVRVGQEINYKGLYPIPFVQQPLLESKIIIRHIERKVAAQLQDSSTAKITSYFMRPNSYQLDTPKLVKSIQETVLEIQMNDKTKLDLELYTSHRRQLITELVINHFMLRRLELDKEKDTKRAFGLIKNDVFNIVEFNKSLENGLCKFSVNKAMLLLKLKDHGLRVYMPIETEESQMNQSILSPDFDLTLEYQPRKKNLIETELILNDFNSDIRDSSSVNVDLLIEVLEAYALNQHVMNAEIVEVDIVVRKRLDKISLLECVRRFLKLDLKLAGFSGRTLIGYGIEFKVQENILVFSGIVNSNIKNTTLVVQIVSRRGQILREIWLHGVEAEKKEEKDEERKLLMQEIL